MQGRDTSPGAKETSKTVLRKFPRKSDDKTGNIMRTEDNEILLEYLKQQSGPVERTTAMVESGLIEPTHFNNAVSYLESKGELVVINRKRIALPKTAGYVKAVIVRQNRYFLFAHPLEDEMDDIFIHATTSKNAMPGDTVMIKNIRDSEKGPSGEVDKVLEKGSRIITGTIERERGKKGQAYIIPDSGFAYHLRIIQGGELKSKDGDKVKAAVAYHPKEKRIYARVIHIYGRANSAKVCSDAIIDAAGIPTKFAVSVKHEAALTAAEPITEAEIAKRLDLRNEPIFTIDGADAKDLDDAISVKKTEKGWELGVHIADVSHYIREGTQLDQAAMDRGTSVYFSDRVIPMLPTEISNGCCSLNAGVKKLTFSALMTLDEKAELVDYRFEKTVIESKVRGVYSEVNAILDGSADEAIKEKYAPVMEGIFASQELAELLKAKSRQRGELEIETDELRFVLDDRGVCVDVALRERGLAEEMIEQFMITANRAAALYAKSAMIPFVYRVHEAPEAERLESLSELAAACGFSVRRLKEGVHQTDLSELINKAKETKYGRLISTQVLRTMAKARYDDKPLGHFGLSLQDYCHFTSPIRRYPDTSIHRILTDLISGIPIDEIQKHYEAFAKESARISSDRELRAMRAERDAEKCYAAEYMTSHIGEEYDGIVSGITNKGLFISIPSGIEGFVSLVDDAHAFFEYDGIARTTDRRNGTSYSIGDAVRVKAQSASVPLGEIDFSLVPVRAEETDEQK